MLLPLGTALVACEGEEEEATPTAAPTPEPTSILVPKLILTPPFPTPAPSSSLTLSSLTKAKSVITVKAEGVVVHYQEESFWPEDQFARIIDLKADFARNQVEGLISDVSAGGERGERVVNPKVQIDEGRRLTILSCDVHGAISKSGNSYSATFFWLLTPLGLDFVDNDFRGSEKGLFWEGSLDSVPTTVRVELPVIDSIVYKAWAYPIGHCHAHVWWQTEGEG